MLRNVCTMSVADRWNDGRGMTGDRGNESHQIPDVSRKAVRLRSGEAVGAAPNYRARHQVVDGGL